MRRVLTLYATLILFTFSFASCEQEDDTSLYEEMLSIVTRSTSNEGTVAPFTDNFYLELWNNVNNTHETHSMQYNLSLGTWNTENTIKTSVLPATVLAYRGNYVHATSPDNYVITLSSDQSDEDKYKNADVMIAKGTATKGETLSLNFEHYFANVIFFVTLGNEFNSSETISKFYVETTNYNSVSEVTAFKWAANEYRAYIPAGTYQAGSDFVKIAIGDYTGDNQLVAKVPTGGLTVSAGTQYTFNIKVGKDAAPSQTPKTLSRAISTANTNKSEWQKGDKIPMSIILISEEAF